MTVGDRSSVIVQIFLYFFGQTFNLLTDVGLLVEVLKSVDLCDNVLNQNTTNAGNITVANRTVLNGTGQTIHCSTNETYFTKTALEGAKSDVRNMLITIAVFALIIGVFFIAQLVMYFKYLKARSSSEFEFDIDKSTFLKHFYKIHSLLLCGEAVLHDLPIGFIVVELCTLVWKQPNCWECMSLFSSEIPEEVSLSKTNLWLGLKLASLVPISLYKGMFPMFMWIGGPFCGMDCYICRVCLVVPCGILVGLLLLTPICGMILLRLAPLASGINEGVPNTVWSIGLIFWAMTIIVGTLLCVCCVPRCRTWCFRYGPCQCLDCFGLGAKKKETITKEEANQSNNN